MEQESQPFFLKWEIILMSISGLLAAVLYLWLRVSESHIAVMQSLPVFLRYEDLKNALLSVQSVSNDKKIPCAIIRGRIREKSLRIHDLSLREGVMRQYTVDELYDVGSPDGKVHEESFHYTSILEPVEFGLAEQDGQDWLIEEMLPPEDFESVMTQIRCDVERHSTFHKSGFSTRQLKRVTTTVYMLIIGEPITIVGSVWVNANGKIQFGRPAAGYAYPNFMISRQSPESLCRNTEVTTNTINAGFLVCTILAGAGVVSLIRKFLLSIGLLSTATSALNFASDSPEL